MKDKDITAENVEDFIRERKRNGAKYIRWGKNGGLLIKRFIRASLSAYDLPKNLNGLRFMGLTHYFMKRKKKGGCRK